MGSLREEYRSGLPFPSPVDHILSVQYLGAISKAVFPVHFQGKPFNITVIQVYAPTTNNKEAEDEWFCEDLQNLLVQLSSVQLLSHVRFLATP